MEKIRLNDKILFCPLCHKGELVMRKNNLFCTKCIFSYYINVASASVGIIEMENKILFVKRKYEPFKGFLHLPGGFVSPFESAEDALYREIKEETNLKIKKSKYIFSIPNDFIYLEFNYNVLDLYFHIKINKAENIKKGSDADDIIWINKNNISLNDIGFKSVRQAISLFLNRQ